MHRRPTGSSFEPKTRRAERAEDPLIEAPYLRLVHWLRGIAVQPDPLVVQPEVSVQVAGVFQLSTAADKASCGAGMIPPIGQAARAPPARSYRGYVTAPARRITSGCGLHRIHPAGLVLVKVRAVSLRVQPWRPQDETSGDGAADPAPWRGGPAPGAAGFGRADRGTRGIRCAVGTAGGGKPASRRCTY